MAISRTTPFAAVGREGSGRPSSRWARCRAKVGVREEDHGHVMVPALPRAALELVEAEDPLGLPVELLDRPPEAGPGHELLEARGVEAPAQVGLQLPRPLLQEEPADPPLVLLVVASAGLFVGEL